MAQVTRGVRALLSSPLLYESFQTVVGARRARRLFIEDHVKPSPSDRILDVGCGTGAILDSMPAVQYVGFDLSAKYIEVARKKYRHCGSFHVGDVSEVHVRLDDEFDIVLAFGLLHHLDDRDVLSLLVASRRLLRSGGRLVTIDGVIAEGQHPFARWMIRRDRGQNVRTESALQSLATQQFTSVKTVLRRDLLRIPYTHVVMECVNC